VYLRRLPQPVAVRPLPPELVPGAEERASAEEPRVVLHRSGDLLGEGSPPLGELAGRWRAVCWVTDGKYDRETPRTSANR
jgi:hypothetical protein